MKAQGLPMTTIVLIILVLIVLAVVAIFFVTQVGTGEKTTDDQQNFATCQTRCKRAQELAPGFTCDTVNYLVVRERSDFCIGMHCDDYVKCEVTFKGGSPLTLTCSTPSCS